MADRGGIEMLIDYGDDKCWRRNRRRITRMRKRMMMMMKAWTKRTVKQTEAGRGEEGVDTMKG